MKPLNQELEVLVTSIWGSLCHSAVNFFSFSQFPAFVAFRRKLLLILWRLFFNTILVFAFPPLPPRDCLLVTWSRFPSLIVLSSNLALFPSRWESESNDCQQHLYCPFDASAGDSFLLVVLSYIRYKSKSLPLFSSSLVISHHVRNLWLTQHQPEDSWSSGRGQP